MLKVLKFTLFFLSFLVCPLSFAANSSKNDIPEFPVKMTAQTFKSNDGKLHLALNYQNYPKWHTYWKNPGDAGLPLKFEFKADGKEVKLESLEWPAPTRYIEQGNMLAYGYSNEYSIFFPIDQKTLKQIKGKPFSVHSKWLVCKHVCIPGQETVTGVFTGDAFHSKGQQKISFSQETLKTNFSKIPQRVELPSYLDIVLTKKPDKNKLALFYNYSEKGTQNHVLSKKNLLTPFPVEPFDFHREGLFKDKKGNLYGKIPIEWDGEYSEPQIPFPAKGKFEKPYTLRFLFADPKDGKVKVVEKTFSGVNLEAYKTSDDFLKLLVPFVPGKNMGDGGPSGDGGGKKTIASDSSTPASSNSLFYYFLFAFLGGLILNIMPCVLPVISLKLFGLIKHSDQSHSQILKHNVFYSLGVISTFLLLGGVVLILKAAGEQVGWGFQLQSPSFVAGMILILFIFSLNLFGLFEFATPGGRKLGNVHLKNDFSGDFLSGVLATILATPCSAPFLGTALTFAFTSSPLAIFSTFFFIGLGLSAPFLVTGIFPKTIKFLPKPGKWMEDVKKFLGLTLILTIIWLYDVYFALVDNEALSISKLNLALAFTFFAFFLYKKITKNTLTAVVFFGVPLLLFSSILFNPNKGPDTAGVQNSKNSIFAHSDLKWETWSEAKMEELKGSEDLVFMDFTAKWCFTCKVNEKVVLDSDGFKALVKEKNLKLLLADWTKRDPIIEKFLRKNGHVGVPAYFVQNKKGELIKLGETISVSKIKKHLE